MKLTRSIRLALWALQVPGKALVQRRPENSDGFFWNELGYYVEPAPADPYETSYVGLPTVRRLLQERLIRKVRDRLVITRKGRNAITPLFNR